MYCYTPSGAMSANDAKNHIFNFTSFDEFEQVIKDGIDFLESNVTEFQCFSTPDGFETE